LPCFWLFWAHTAHGGASPRWFTPLLLHFTSFGWIGVNLFFVLSGFLITCILLDSRERTDFYRRFYYRRALRILPAYALTILIYTIVFERNWQFVALTVVYLYNFASLFKVTGGYSVLWSLAVEEQFYLIWPTFIRRCRISVVAGTALTIVAICPAARALSIHLGYSTADAYTWFVADALALGGLIAVLLRHRDVNTRKIAFAGAGALLASATAVSIAAAIYRPLTRDTLPGAPLLYTCASVGSAGLILLFIASAQGRLRSFVQAAPLRFYGKISYGLYLSHSMVFWTLDRAWRPATSVNPLLRVCVGLAACTAIAALSRYTFEEFFLQLKDSSADMARRAVIQLDA